MVCMNRLILSISNVLLPALVAMCSDALALMIPWLLVMVAAIVADLVSGLRKSWKFGVEISLSTALKETIFKLINYTTFVMGVCVFDVAAQGESKYAKWCCALVAAIEIGSSIGNILKPYGVNLSLQGIVRMVMRRSPLALSEDETQDIVNEDSREAIREKEHDRWNRKPRARRN